VKVAILNYEFPPQGGGGGVVMRDLAERMARFGDIEQTLIFGWDPTLGVPSELDRCTMRPVEIRRRSIHSTGAPAVLQFLWRARSTLSAPQDLLHFHFSIPTGLLRWAAPKIPYICSMHGIDVPGFISEEAVLFQRLLAPLNRRIVRGAARVIVPSHALAAALRLQVPQARIEVVPHAIDVGEFAQKTDYPGTARRFVTVARLTALKRVDHIVRAVSDMRARVADVSLDIYGDGDQRTAIEELIARLDASSYVRLHGFVEKSKLCGELCKYDTFVLPSVTEAFGLVYLEAMAAGLPVIAANYAGPAEIVSHGVDGLLIRRDSQQDLTAAMLRLAQDVGLVSTLGLNARAKVSSAFDWQRVTERMRAIYREAADG